MKRTPGGWLIVLLLWVATFAVIYWLNEVTTPASCKVPVDQMSQFCKDLLFPH